MHDGEGDLLLAALPFVREGLARGEAVVVVDSADRLERIAAALGRDADRVRFEDGMSWWQGPWRTFAAYERTVRGLLEDHPGVRAVAHPCWMADAGNREWRRFESYANLHFDGWPYRSLCAYDHGVLGAAVCAEAACTHPLLQRDRVTPSPDYRDPGAFVASCTRSVPAPAPEVRLALGSPGDLGAARRAIADWARRRAVPPPALERLVLAMTELASNALRHGGGAAAVDVGRRNGTVLLDVADRGAGDLDPLAPYRPPPPDVVGGWGLWVVAAVCDEVQVVPGPGGTRVRCMVDV